VDFVRQVRPIERVLEELALQIENCPVLISTMIGTLGRMPQRRNDLSDGFRNRLRSRWRKCFRMIESWENLTIVAEWLSGFSYQVKGFNLSDFIRLIGCSLSLRNLGADVKWRKSIASLLPELFDVPFSKRQSCVFCPISVHIQQFRADLAISHLL
jgi:hypothetical protein